MNQKRIVLIDAYSLLYRAFYAIQYLNTSDGRPTNALYGFTNLLFNIIDKVQPDAIVVAFDAPGKTFRHTHYAEYKAKRKETPDELKQQLIFSRDLIQSLGIPFQEQVGYEADDVIGTLSLLAEKHGYQTTIVTGDLDALQLVDANVSVMSTRKGVSDVILYTPETVKERFGFEPELVPDYKALVGDTSDNIPGVPGVGEKTATKIIQQYGNIESLLQQLSEVEPKILKKIEHQTEQIKFSKYLATIERKVPIEYDFAPYEITPKQLESASKMFEFLEFRNLQKKLEATLRKYCKTSDQISPGHNLTIGPESLTPKILTPFKHHEDLLHWINGRDYALYFDSDRLQPSMFDQVKGTSAYIAINQEVCKLDVEQGIELFKQFPSQAVLHDGKPLYKLAKGIFQAPKFDTALAAYILQSNRAAYPLSYLTQHYLDAHPPESPEQCAVAVLNLKEPLKNQIMKESQDFIYDQIELPLIPILADMENKGIAVSKEILEDFSKSLEVTIQQVAKQIYELAGQEFLIGSTKQLGEILFDKLGIPRTKKNKTGFSTGAEALQELALAYPICGEVLSWRELTKLKSTYADALPKMIQADGRIHTTFNQMMAATGRLSSYEPNLQNIPVRTELGRQIRKAFIASKGTQLLSLDYSQIELRILAHFCQDEALIHAFHKNEDVHAVTAGLMFDIPTQQVDPEQRRLAKTLNFAVLYGVSDFGLASQLGTDFTIQNAKSLIEQYNERFPKVKHYTQNIIEEARKKGFTTTLCGRRRYFPDIHSANRNQRLYAERQAMNAPFQGTASDMIKLAMIKIYSQLQSKTSKMLLQVHDELLFEIQPNEKELIPRIKKWMETALPLNVPIGVDGKIGQNWYDMTPI